MAFKTFYSLIWIFLILFTVVKGSCLEYGHSCWGAHGKRSGNNKIYHADTNSPTELDFSDLNGIKEAINEKNTYESTEEEDLNGPHHDLTQDNNNMIESSEKSENFKKFYKQFKKNVKQHNSDNTPEQHKPQASNSLSMISERWRRLPLYNIRRLQITNPDNEWLRAMENEAQNDVDYI